MLVEYLGVDEERQSGSVSWSLLCARGLEVPQADGAEKRPEEVNVDCFSPSICGKNWATEFVSMPLAYAASLAELASKVPNCITAAAGKSLRGSKKGGWARLWPEIVGTGHPWKDDASATCGIGSFFPFSAWRSWSTSPVGAPAPASLLLTVDVDPLFDGTMIGIDVTPPTTGRPLDAERSCSCWNCCCCCCWLCCWRRRKKSNKDACCACVVLATWPMGRSAVIRGGNPEAKPIRAWLDVVGVTGRHEGGMVEAVEAPFAPAESTEAIKALLTDPSAVLSVIMLAKR